jgi:hypothetical protein
MLSRFFLYLLKLLWKNNPQQQVEIQASCFLSGSGMVGICFLVVADGKSCFDVL